VWAYSEVRSVVSQPKCKLIRLFSWIPDDGRAPATGIRRVDLEPTDANISPVSVRLALFKVAGYPGNFSRRGTGTPLSFSSFPFPATPLLFSPPSLLSVPSPMLTLFLPSLHASHPHNGTLVGRQGGRRLGAPLSYHEIPLQRAPKEELLFLILLMLRALTGCSELSWRSLGASGRLLRLRPPKWGCSQQPFVRAGPLFLAVCA